MESTIRMEVSRAEEPEPDELTVEQRIAKAGAASTALIDTIKADAAPVEVSGDETGEDASGPEAPHEPRAVAKPSADESDDPDEEEQG
jgi:hypothetical protein